MDINTGITSPYLRFHPSSSIPSIRPISILPSPSLLSSSPSLLSSSPSLLSSSPSLLSSSPSLLSSPPSLLSSSPSLLSPSSSFVPLSPSPSILSMSSSSSSPITSISSTLISSIITPSTPSITAPETKGKEIRIFIKTLSGHTLTLDINTEDTVRELKDEIYLRTGFDPDSQRIIFAGKQLENDLKIGSSLYNQSTSHLVINTEYLPKQKTIAVDSHLTGGTILIRYESGDLVRTIKERLSVSEDIPIKDILFYINKESGLMEKREYLKDDEKITPRMLTNRFSFDTVDHFNETKRIMNLARQEREKEYQQEKIEKEKISERERHLRSKDQQLIILTPDGRKIDMNVYSFTDVDSIRRLIENITGINSYDKPWILDFRK